MLTADEPLNLVGLRCPLPILRAKKALAKMQSGQIVKILVTDPSAPKDFADFCRKSGNELLSSEEISDGGFCLTLRRK